MRNIKLTPRDKYLRKKFEITEAEFDEAFVGQGSVCRCCSRPPTTKALHVDHDHVIEKWKITSKRFAMGRWKAWPTIGSLEEGRLKFSREGRTKSQAIAAVRKVLKRLSIRGILCWRCNTGLKKFNDNPTSLRNASIYLYQYKDYMNGDREDRNGFK